MSQLYLLALLNTLTVSIRCELKPCGRYEMTAGADDFGQKIQDKISNYDSPKHKDCYRTGVSEACHPRLAFWRCAFFGTGGVTSHAQWCTRATYVYDALGLKAALNDVRESQTCRAQEQLTADYSANFGSVRLQIKHACKTCIAAATLPFKGAFLSAITLLPVLPNEHALPGDSPYAVLTVLTALSG